MGRARGGVHDGAPNRFFYLSLEMRRALNSGGTEGRGVQRKFSSEIAEVQSGTLVVRQREIPAMVPDPLLLHPQQFLLFVVVAADHQPKMAVL